MEGTKEVELIVTKERKKVEFGEDHVWLTFEAGRVEPSGILATAYRQQAAVRKVTARTIENDGVSAIGIRPGTD